MKCIWILSRLKLHQPFIKLSNPYSSVHSSVILRPYQERCLEACTEALTSGSSRIGISLPTGSGKTTVFISLLARIPSPVNNQAASRSLIIVNSVELAKQSAEQVARLFPDWTVEIEQGSKNKATGLADVTIATYQTLLNPQRLAKFNPRSLKAIIVDEAHHAAAPSYRRLLSHFDANIKNPDIAFKTPDLPHKIPIIGFSATFSRHDGLALGSVFERIVYHRDFLEMIKEQWLCDVRFTSVKARIDLSDVKISTRTGDFSPRSLAHVINTDTINHLVVKSWIDRASSRKSTLVFCVNVAHVHALTQTFRAYGIDARYLYADTPAAERHALVASFRAGQFPVLINCAILTEGADIPNIDCVLVARPTRSRNIFSQMIGRGMRLSPQTGKIDCHVIDFVDSTSSVPGMVSTPTLFGLDPAEVTLDNTTLESIEAIIDSPAAQPKISADIPEPTSVTFVDHQNPFSFDTETTGAPHVAKLSRNAWVGCGGEIYVLECIGKGHVRIEPVKAGEQDHYVAYFTPAQLDKSTASAFNMSIFLRSRKVLTAQSLGDAIRGCDTYAENKVLHGTMSMALLRSAKWRKSPATDSQKQYIMKRWNKKTNDLEGNDTQLEKVASLTKGDAANIITRLRHGAQARFEKKKQEVARIRATSLKESLRRAREVVQVGPLGSGINEV